MTTWLLRIVFVALLFASFVKAAGQHQPVDWTEQAPGVIVQALTEQGLVLEKTYRLVPRGIPPVMAFKVSGCEHPLQVVPLQINLTEVPFLDAAADAGYVRRYVYLGKVWTKPDAVALRLDWLKQRVLGLMSQSPYVMERMALFVSSPPQCNAVERIDWTQVWLKPSSMSAAHRPIRANSS